MSLLLLLLLLLLILLSVLFAAWLFAGRGVALPRGWRRPSAFRLVTDRAELRAACGERYFEAMTSCDLAARRCRSTRDCLERYLSALLPSSACDAETEARLAEAIALAEATLRPRLSVAAWHARHARHARHALDAPWRIALLDDGVEGGWPHTHGDVVCLPISLARRRGDERRLAMTMAHERVHVLQRTAPGALMFDPPLESRARVAVASFPGGSDVARRLRSNPDLDGYLYCDDEDEKDGRDIRGQDVRGQAIRGQDVRGQDIRGQDVRGQDIRGQDIRGQDVRGLCRATLFDDERSAAEGGLAAARLRLVDPVTGDVAEGAKLSREDEPHAREHPNEAMAYAYSTVS